MIDREGHAARGHTLASNLREELRAASEKRVSKPPSRTAPDISRRRLVVEALCGPPPLKKGLMCSSLRACLQWFGSVPCTEHRMPSSKAA